MANTLERTSTDPESMRNWKIADAIETYGIRNWGKGYFGINKPATSPSTRTSIPSRPST